MTTAAGETLLEKLQVGISSVSRWPMVITTPFRPPHPSFADRIQLLGQLADCSLPFRVPH